ncbi:MAG: peptidyl-prolyl cis-trans isomerase [Planctomycetes bacterium]|nr:peptidyl-prolyl cis-trans isomerase [Planctomycetota bacterium]
MLKALVTKIVIPACLVSLFFLGNFYVQSAQAGTPTLVQMKTSKGDMTIELFDEKAPITVKNFLSYVSEGFYDNLIFHRVIAGFMIQGGGLDSEMREKDNHSPIKNEAGNKCKNLKYTVAMARTGIIDSATSQFFINLVNNGFLDHKNNTRGGFGYAVFGKVIEGLDVVDAIGKVKTGVKNGFRDVPAEPVFIKTMTVLD